MNKKELRNDYHVLAKELMDAITTVYDAIGIVNDKRGETVINPEDRGLPELVEAAKKISENNNPTPDDLDKAIVLTRAIKSILIELEEAYAEELGNLWIPWGRQQTESKEASKVIQKLNRLLSRQYHGTIAGGDEI